MPPPPYPALLTPGLVDVWFTTHGGGGPRGELTGIKVPMIGTPWSKDRYTHTILANAASKGAALANVPSAIKPSLPVTFMHCGLQVGAPTAWGGWFGMLYADPEAAPFAAWEFNAGGSSGGIDLLVNDGTNLVTVSGPSNGGYFGKHLLMIGRLHAGGAELLVYAQGIARTKNTASGSYSGPLYSATSHLMIGHDTTNTTRNPNAHFSWAAVWNRLWTDKECDALAEQVVGNHPLTPWLLDDQLAGEIAAAAPPVAPTGRIMSSLAYHGGLAGEGGIAGIRGGLAA